MPVGFGGAAAQEEQATKNPSLPWAFFIVQATALSAVFAAQAFPAPASIVVAVLGAATVVVVGVRHVFRRPGYGFVAPDGESAFPYLIAVLVGVTVPAAVAIGLEARWPWLVADVLTATATLELGRRYRKATAGA